MSETKDEHESMIVAPEHGSARQIHPIVAAAIQSGALAPGAITIETLRELVALQRDLEAAEAKKLYDRALVDLKRDMPSVVGHDSDVDYTNKSGVRTQFPYASLAAVMSAVTDAMNKHGFAVTWHPRTEKGLVCVKCRLSHVGGHFEEVELSAPPDDKGGKGASEAIMSTITRLERYAAMALLGLATRDMREKPSEPDKSGVVDVQLNMQAVAAIKKQGIDVEALAAKIGRPPAEWTGADLDVVRAALKEARGGSGNAPPAASVDPDGGQQK